jgi:hypothetical protein
MSEKQISRMPSKKCCLILHEGCRKLKQRVEVVPVEKGFWPSLSWVLASAPWLSSVLILYPEPAWAAK